MGDIVHMSPMGPAVPWTGIKDDAAGVSAHPAADDGYVAQLADALHAFDN